MSDRIEVTEPGVYDLPADAYHGDPVPAAMGGSLSFSGAKRLLPPSCPARFKWERDHGRPNKASFDFGHAAHREVLGVGVDLAIVDADDWRTKAAREAKAAAYAEGKVPTLRDDYDVVQEMAEQIKAHPIAGRLLSPERGTAEQAIFWQDERTGVWRRQMVDQLQRPEIGGRFIVTDYKSTTEGGADPAEFSRSLVKFCYHMQAAWYCDGVQAVGLTDDPAFLFVVQEKVPPYLVSVFEPDAEAIDYGRQMNDRAIDVYSECASTGTWPGYGDDIALVGVPGWYARQHELMETL